MINHYELLYLVGATYTEEELSPIKEKIKSMIEKFQGEITLEDNLGKKKLAYPVKKNHQGYYLLYEFDLEGSNLKDLNQNIKLANEILRHVIVKKKLKTPSLLKATKEKLETEEKVAKEEKETAKEKRIQNDKDKIKLEDLDEKLDQILDGDII
jgi:small subunit ribosomal protein S6